MLNSVFMMVSIYYRYFLRLSGLAIIGPCMAIISLSEPSGTIEEPPRLFLVAHLALKVTPPGGVGFPVLPLILTPSLPGS